MQTFSLSRRRRVIKLSFLCGLIASVASASASGSAALAAGMIMIDPAFSPMPRLGLVNIVRPGPARPNPSIRPPVSTTPILRGGVTFGLRLESQDIRVEITDQVARTYIVQTFANDSDQNLAGNYLFPLPEDTTFSSFSLHIDGKPVEGKILEAHEARAQYEAIVRQMVDPGLLEYADYKTVRARIFPIPAHGTKKVELEYTQLLKAENGLIKYRYPLKGDPQVQGDQGTSKISVKLSGKQGLRTIWSPSHTVDVKREENNRAKVAFAGGGANNSGADHDFLLYYSVSDKDVQANLLTHKVASTSDENGYFLLSLAPPVKNAVVIPKDIVLVADTSGSMQGEKLAQTKKALKYVVDALSPGDRFGLVQFNTDADAFKNTLVSASPENKKAAEAFINDLEPHGGTNISEALNTGAALLNSPDARPAYLVMITDGEPTVGETTVAGVLKAMQTKRDIRLFDFGVGYDVNTRLLNQLADQHHGTSQFLEPGENLETALSSFYNKIKSPVMADCQISYNGITVKDVYPRAVKDIFAGTQVLLLGRYKGAGKASVTVSGKVNGQAKSFVFPLEFAQSETANSYLPRLWAMRRIGHLTDAAQQNGDNREIVDEIVALSQKYGIISAYTSFLATDPGENHRLPGGRLANANLTNSPLHRNRQIVSALPSMGATNGDSFNSLGGIADSAGLASAAPVRAANASRWDFAPNFYGSNNKQQLFDASSSVGQKAVTMAKSVARLKESDDAISDKVEAKAREQSIKQAQGKTFYLSADGKTWVDGDYKGEKAEEISFASTRYFDLARTGTKMAAYLAVGQQVVFICAGHAYKIVVK